MDTPAVLCSCELGTVLHAQGGRGGAGSCVSRRVKKQPGGPRGFVGYRKTSRRAKSETRPLRRPFLHTRETASQLPEQTQCNTLAELMYLAQRGVSVYYEKTKQGQLWPPPVVATVTACPGCSHPQHGRAPAKAALGHVPCDPESSGTAPGAVGASAQGHWKSKFRGPASNEAPKPRVWQRARVHTRWSGGS